MADLTVILLLEILGNVLPEKVFVQVSATIIRLVQDLHHWQRCSVSVLVTQNFVL